jgi:serine/threonine-protein kinase HipA
MGIPANRKYQAKGGPGFEECRQLIDEHLLGQGAQVRIEMASALAFNFIIGNHDAHGKNFSIIHAKELEMAPYYDLLSTQVYPGLENHFAMAIGKTFRHDRIKSHSFETFAQTMKVRPAKLAEIMNSVIQSVDHSYDGLHPLMRKIMVRRRYTMTLKKLSPRTWHGLRISEMNFHH